MSENIGIGRWKCVTCGVSIYRAARAVCGICNAHVCGYDCLHEHVCEVHPDQEGK